MENTPEFRRLGWHRPTGSSAVLTFQLPTISCVDGEAGRISMTVCAPGSNFQFDVSAETSSRFCHPVSAQPRARGESKRGQRLLPKQVESSLFFQLEILFLAALLLSGSRS